MKRIEIDRSGFAERARLEPSSWLHRFATLFQSRAETDLPITIREALFGTVVQSASNLLMVAVAFFACGMAGYVKGASPVYSAFAFLGVISVILRAYFILVFQRRVREDRAPSLDFSIVIFSLLAIVSSICWGSISFIVITASEDAALVTITTLSTVGTAGAVAARNCVMPRLAKTMLITSLLPLMVGSLFAADHGFRVLLLLIPAMTKGLFILIDEHCQQLVDLFLTQKKLSSLSNLDPLTQLSNRRHFDDGLANMATMADARKAPFAVLMIDVDYFKAFNDRYGHMSGDACLQRIADTVGAHSREGDLVARYGGEEFVVLLDGADADEAKQVAERLRHAVAALAIPHESRPDDANHITISIGCASTDSQRPKVETLVDRADRALYRAKDAGRNTVICSV